MMILDFRTEKNVLCNGINDPFWLERKIEHILHTTYYIHVLLCLCNFVNWWRKKSYGHFIIWKFRDFTFQRRNFETGKKCVAIKIVVALDKFHIFQTRHCCNQCYAHTFSSKNRVSTESKSVFGAGKFLRNEISGADIAFWFQKNAIVVFRIVYYTLCEVFACILLVKKMSYVE